MEVTEKKRYSELLVFHDHTEQEFRDLWSQEYCRKLIKTHDGIRVHFYDNNFNHAFYESSQRNQSGRKKSKDILSPRRLARMMWIKDVLTDPEAEMYVGYDSASQSYTQSKRVSVVKNDYVVVIQIYKEKEARFITAFNADNSIDKIKMGPRWQADGGGKKKER